ncbi:hypothetical protein [Sphingomonas sp. Leaf67]|uniref:hypothetical protein n=1 Tax=Sphingomonas sp. Leaf67 TaxID=1736230 RepID=UPI0012E3034E|nr:hypothetical protein [Sphingomonas sp. Leaf67]
MERIFTDANSHCHLAFTRISASEPHHQTKPQPALIPSSNASFRDMLARFNRRIKRDSKTCQVLELNPRNIPFKKARAKPKLNTSRRGGVEFAGRLTGFTSCHTTAAATLRQRRTQCARSIVACRHWSISSVDSSVSTECPFMYSTKRLPAVT